MARRAAVLLLVLVTIGCQREPTATTPAPGPPAEAGPLELPGLHNVFRVGERLFSGSAPEGEEGFRSLRELGVRTVVSVDGMRPDVEAAHRYGLRYVHLPVGYDGVPREQGLRLARAVRDLPGPVYLHCHHGKHRGPAAAAVVRLCLDPACPVEAAVEDMRRAGTDPRYVGLYDSPRKVGRPTAAELDAVAADFPEVAEVTGLAQFMVRVDECWERLKLVRDAGWVRPPKHPDVDPPHEAVLLAEHYREAARCDDAAGRPEELRRGLEDAEQTARSLEEALRPVPGRPVDAAAAQRAFQAAADACSHCHARYRDVPRGR